MKTTKTEIQKAMDNQFNDIDFNKLIMEMSEINKQYEQEINPRGKTLEEFRKIGKETIMRPAVDAMFVFNAIMNCLSINDASAPFILAGLDMTKSLFQANLSKHDIETMNIAKQILEIGTTGIRY